MSQKCLDSDFDSTFNFLKYSHKILFRKGQYHPRCAINVVDYFIKYHNTANKYYINVDAKLSRYRHMYVYYIIVC